MKSHWSAPYDHVTTQEQYRVETSDQANLRVGAFRKGRPLRRHYRTDGSLSVTMIHKRRRMKVR